MKYSLTIVFFSCFIQISLGTNSDTVVNKLKTIKDDSLKIEYLCDLCAQFTYSDKDKAKQYCQYLIDQSKKYKSGYSKADAYKVVGTYFQEVQDFSNAILYYNNAISISEKLNNSKGKILYAKTLASFGTLYHYNGDFESALKLYLKADSILSMFNEVNSLIKVYSRLSDLYDRLNQLDKSYIYYKKIVKLSEQTSDPQSIASAYISYANSVVDSGKYEIAEKYLLKAIKISENINDFTGISTAYYNLGYLESRRKNYKKALEYNKKVLDIAIQTQNKYDECDALNKIGRNNYFLGNYKTAQSSLEEGIAIARKNEYRELLRKLIDVAVSVEEALGNYRKALYYREEYTTLYLETVDIKVQQQVNFLDAKYNAQKRETEICQLENDKKIRDLKISKRQQWIYGLLIIIALLLILALFIYFNYRHKHEIARQEATLKEQKIRQLENEKQLLATQSVLQGEEAERGRLAKDLHDGLGGLLSGVKLSLTNLKGNFILSDETTTKFNQTLNLLDSSIKEMRRISHNMMPEALVKFGIKDALSDFCNNINKQVGITFKFYGMDKRIDPKIEISVYRIALELINNAIKHASASEISVQLVLEKDRVHLNVSDNGKGFDPSNIDIAKSTGLQNIRARVQSFNGQFDISSKPEEGTEITVEFAIK